MSGQKSDKRARKQKKDSNRHEQPCKSEKVSCETIREAAYYKWEAAGRPCSDGVEFWLQAESESSADIDPSRIN